MYPQPVGDRGPLREIYACQTYACPDLRLSLRLEHGGVERLARGLAGPDHELEGREVALAGIERGAEQRLALPARGFDPAGQHQRMAVHDQPVLRPQIEV